MKRLVNRALAMSVIALAVLTPARADFAGQTILGPLSLGSIVNGDTTGASDDNDGFSSGGHFFFIWNGPDDVWAINWLGGDLALTMTYNNAASDLDLFLYEPGSLDDSSNYSIVNTGIENILEPAAGAGTYYIVVDSTSEFDAGAYTLSVTPEPGAGALLSFGLALLVRRRR